MENALECSHVFKSYKQGSPILSNFNLTVPAGKIFGLLGPNGCGKSTLIKLVSGLLVPDSGTISICGTAQSEKTNSLISYLPERTYFDRNMKVTELIRYFSDFYSDFDADVANGMLADLKIPPSAKMKTLSKGTKEKVQLILVMSRRAGLYLLDEPIGGVDPAARDYILGTILNNRKSDSAILITTHLISDVESVLDDFAFMNYGGNIMLSGNAEDTRQMHGKSLNDIFREVFRFVR